MEIGAVLETRRHKSNRDSCNFEIHSARRGWREINADGPCGPGERGNVGGCSVGRLVVPNQSMLP